MVDSYIITTENGNKFLLVNPIKYKGATYYQATRVEENNKLTSEYCTLKQIQKDGKEYYEVVKDKTTCQELMTLFTLMIMQDVSNELPKEGQIMELGGREYALLSYIAYNNQAYMYLVTIEEPADIVIGKLVPTEGEDIEIEDVTVTDEGVEVIKLHSQIYG